MPRINQKQEVPVSSYAAMNRSGTNGAALCDMVDVDSFCVEHETPSMAGRLADLLRRRPTASGTQGSVQDAAAGPLRKLSLFPRKTWGASSSGTLSSAMSSVPSVSSFSSRASRISEILSNASERLSMRSKNYDADDSVSPWDTERPFRQMSAYTYDRHAATYEELDTEYEVAVVDFDDFADFQADTSEGDYDIVMHIDDDEYKLF
eukprot:IDg9741t1